MLARKSKTKAARLSQTTRLSEGPAAKHRLYAMSVASVYVAEPLMKEIRYVDKLVDEVAQGRDMAKILRAPVEDHPQRSGVDAPKLMRTASPTRKSAAEPTVARGVHPSTLGYNREQTPALKAVCNLLAAEIAKALPEAENKIWHRPPGMVPR